MTEKMTVSSGNLFEDLGFAPDEAAAMMARETLLIALEQELRKRGKKQQELAEELGVPRTRISEVLNHKKYTDSHHLGKQAGPPGLCGR